jgi:hypothetical protein
MIHESKIHLGARIQANLLMLGEQLFGARAVAGLKRRFLRRLEARLAAAPGTSPKPVDRRDGLTAEEFQRDYFRASLPVIFSGAASAWACCKRWDLDYFSVAHGDNDLLIVNSNGLTSRENHSNYEFLSVRDLVGNIRKGGDKYLRFSPLLHENPVLAADLDLKWLGKMRGGKTFGNTYYMFMGGAGKKTLLHADQPCNLYVQVYGQKKWTLFLPQDSAGLYPEVTNTAYVKSPLDIDTPDTSRYPLYKAAQAYEAYLKPGDVLYVPPHVWHQVENLTDTIAVGYRFSSLGAAVRSSLTFSLLRILSTNPPVWKTREYGKVDTNLIWAHTGGRIKEVLAQRELRRQAKSAHEEISH